MKLKDFIAKFSQNNELWIQNKKHLCLEYRYNSSSKYIYDVVMDWMMQYTDIADCEVIRIANVFGHITHGITIEIDTDKEKFEFVPELVTDTCPVWFYERVHNIKIHVGTTGDK